MNTSTSGRVSEKKGVSSKRKMKDNVSRSNKKKSRAVNKVGKKSGGVGKSAVKEVYRPNVFRCNLAVVVEEIISLKGRGEIKNGHIEAMMKTPFGSMFKAIFDDKIIPDHIGMIGQVGKKIISAYSEKYSAFLIAREVVKLTPDDVSVTFGLPKHGSKIIPRSSESVCGSEFMQRRFKGESSLKVSSVLSTVRSTVLEDGAEEDFARCLILYLLATVFFANSNRALALSFVPCVEDLDKVADFQWATIIHDHLMKMVKKNYKDHIRTPGCVIQLLMKRAKITHLLLTDKDHSWEPEVGGVPKELAEEGVDDKSADKGGGCGDSVNSIIDDAITFVVENEEEFSEFDE
ncbi:hypothetical protein LguiA_025902 [Lonicera macranthoides]